MQTPHSSSQYVNNHHESSPLRTVIAQAISWASASLVATCERRAGGAVWRKLRLHRGPKIIDRCTPAGLALMAPSLELEQPHKPLTRLSCKLYQDTLGECLAMRGDEQTSTSAQYDRRPRSGRLLGRAQSGSGLGRMWAARPRRSADHGCARIRKLRLESVTHRVRDRHHTNARAQFVDSSRLCSCDLTK